MAEFKNVFIFVSDALSYGDLPAALVEEAELKPIRTLAPSMHSPKSFASLLTGLEVDNHEVYHFGDKLEQDHVLEMYENSNLFDHEGSGVRYMLDLFENPNIDEMEEPFFWVERSLETHEPYKYCKHHGRDKDEDIPDFEGNYFDHFTDEEIKENYRKAAYNSYEHFKEHVEYLEEQRILDETLVIFTADHGELLGERIHGRKRYSHNVPASRKLAEVPTLFYNHKIEAERMRTVDIIPTALDILGKEWMMDTDGKSILKELPDEGKCPTGPYIFEIDWKWNGKNKRWEMTPSSKIKGVLEDHLPERFMEMIGLTGHEIKFGKGEKGDKVRDKIRKGETVNE
jgi:hypothetical protein